MLAKYSLCAAAVNSRELACVHAFKLDCFHLIQVETKQILVLFFSNLNLSTGLTHPSLSPIFDACQVLLSAWPHRGVH